MIKKRLMLLILILSLVFILTGCMKMRANYVINEDGSGEVEVISAIESEFYSMFQMGGEDPFAELEDMELEEGQELKDFRDANYTGVQFKLSFEEFEQLADRSYSHLIEDFEEAEGYGVDLELDTEDELFEVEARVDREDLYTIYTYREKIDLFADDDAEMAMFFGGFDMGVEFNLPVAAEEHNAHRVANDGKRLIWDFQFGQEEEVFFKMKIPEYDRVLRRGR